MDDQRELPDFVRRLLRANNSQVMVIGSELCYYGFKFDNRISQELYEGRLLTSSDPRGAPIDVVFPWKYLFSGQKEFHDLPKDAELRTGIWTLCYDRFEHNLKDWTNMVKGNVGYYDKLKLPIKTSDGCRLKKFWRDSIRELIVGVGHIHSKGLYHGGLGSESNYVFIGKCLKVINIEGDLDEYEFDEDREEQKKADITDLLGMLDNWFESILAGGKRSWLECQHFFDFVNRAKRKKKLDYDEFVKKVVGHPFLLKADERMRLFDHYETMKSGRTGNKVKFALARSAFDNFKS
ncbi:leucine-rich repeat receptor-like protein kinase PXL2 [Prunus yedoensis var. nudiflora]|uniref:Leucine-rich repeat receptor-like protein kinase PXL2 n=1 Tax=Prunus yedoensis var. nudiflora TaxID=2094558 RepID=A0A314Z3B4_PRUYE|nr:leucine-rich repeat receptor-like protein kinase PXL2 [Prunus yedoensis var. nudiflora]